MSWIEEFSIHLVADADKVEVGLWCDRCKLPSAVKVPLIGMLDTGVANFGYLETCVDCAEDGEIDAELDCG